MPMIADVVRRKEEDNLVSLQEYLEEQVTGALAGALALDALPGPKELRRMLDEAMSRGVVQSLEALAASYAEQVVGAGRYQRSDTRSTRRSGSREKTLYLWGRAVTVSYQKLRRGKSLPPLFEALSKRSEQAQELFHRLWLRGLSSRDLAKESEALAGHGISHETIAADIRVLQQDVLRWQNREIAPGYRFLMLDALYVSVSRELGAQKEAIHLALGVTEDGKKELLEVFVAPTESKESWTSVLRRLQLRGMKTDQLKLVISDGHEGLIQAIAEVLPRVRHQRCVLHKMRNVMGKAPRKYKAELGKGLSHIFEAPNRAEAASRLDEFIYKWRTVCPEAIMPVKDDREEMFAYFDFPKRLWKALRTTNALERVNREFRRKLREVGSLKGDKAAIRITVDIATMLNKEWGDVQIQGFREKLH